MAVTDAGAGGDQAVGRGGELLEDDVERGERDPGDRAGANDPALQLGDFGEGGLDGVLDRADLGGDFVSGTFDDLFAHDCSFPGDDAPEWLSV
jgi:hypothetical protein